MPDRVTVTSRRGLSGRLSESIKGVLFGFVFFVVAFPLLFWNEGRAVRTAKSLEEGSGIVVSVSPDRVDSANEGKLVHMSGFAKTDDVLVDETFGIRESAVHLVREVEMYQWVESESSTTETKIGGSEEKTTTYEYSTEWSDDLIDSSDFHSPGGHQNPRAFPYEARTVSASTVTLGAFGLSGSQVSQIQKSEPLYPAEVPRELAKKARLQEGTFYFGANPEHPAVGDVRVRFRAVRPGALSVVARQVSSTFEPYQAQAGGTVFLLEESVASAEAMFEAAQTQNTIVTWLLRGLGFFLMFAGLGMIFRPIAVFGDVVPLVGTLLRAGTGVFAGLTAAFFSFVTIGIAWFVYRPVLGITLLVLAAGAGFLLLKVALSRPSAVPPPPPVPQRAA
jgi:hypothetical protein